MLLGEMPTLHDTAVSHISNVFQLLTRANTSLLLQGDAAPATAPARPNGIIANGLLPVTLANGLPGAASAPAASKRRKAAEEEDHQPDAQPTAKRRKGAAKAGVLGLSLHAHPDPFVVDHLWSADVTAGRDRCSCCARFL